MTHIHTHTRARAHTHTHTHTPRTNRGLTPLLYVHACPQGFSPEVYQRVCGLSFEAERVRVVLSDSVEPHQHTQALEAVLGQLREMRLLEATGKREGTFQYSQADAVVSTLK